MIKTILGLAVAAVAQQAAAAPVLSLSTTANPASLLAGEIFTVDVVLSGLELGTRLELLAATLTFPAATLGTPTAITFGSITPTPPATPLDLLSISDAGLADISFQTNSPLVSHQITADGIFASVTLTAAAVGTGEISLSFVDALAYNPADPDQPLEVGIEDGAPLVFAVVIPEPATLVCLAPAALLARRTRASSL